MKQVFSIFMLGAFLLGCTPKRYQDISNLVPSQELSVPHGEFESVAWFDENHIAFIYSRDKVTANDLNEDLRIGIFEISTNTIKDLASPLSSDCFSKRSRISNLSRLPDGSLGFIFNCAASGDSLYLLNPDSNEIVKRQSYLGFFAKSFSFSPDMSHIIQENGVGDGLNNELYLVAPEKTITKLLPEFKRARSPAWSSDGKTIAFAGTKENQGNTNITTWKDIESLAYYPWDIYLIDSNGSNPRILLPLVGTIYGLKWSPTNKNLLLFGGNSFNNVDGVWLLDVSDMSVKRIWNENTNFDWSPDGTKIVLLDNSIGTWWSSITVIDITEQ